MNKVYKLVYSRTLNQLMAVSELAKLGKGEIKKSNPANYLEKLNVISDVDIEPPSKLAVGVVLTTLFTAMPVGVAMANERPSDPARSPEITATNSQSLDPTENKYLNYVSENDYSQTNAGIQFENPDSGSVNYVQNVPVVNIANTNEAGVSDNRFSKFQTDTGVVFNNNAKGKVELKSSILAEKIKANPYLEKEAQVILSQVTGNDKTIIRGVMEVLGKKADLIVINPNGIDLNGVRLVNSDNFVAATAEISSDNYRKLKVTEGVINVNKDFSLDDVDMIRLIAKAVKVKAKISTSNPVLDSRKADIIVSAGSQTYDLETNVVSAIKDPITNKSPATSDINDTKVLISGDSLGSMYGNQINFVVTDTGAGVDFGSNLIADDDIYITADGRVRVDCTYAVGKTAITSRSDDVEISTTSRGQGSVNVSAGHDANLKNADIQSSTIVNLAAKNNVVTGDITAPNVNLAAGNRLETADDKTILSNKTIAYGAKSVEFNSKVYVNDSLEVTTENYEATDKSAISLLGDSEVEKVSAQASVTDKSTDSTSIKFNNKVMVSGDTHLGADTLSFKGKRLSEISSDDNSHEFAFNRLKLDFDIDKYLGGVKVSNSSFVSNDLDFKYNKSGDFVGEGQEIFTIENAKYNILGTTHLDFTKSKSLNLVLDSQAKFDRINKLLDMLNARANYIKVSKIDISKEKDIKLSRDASFEVDSFKNDGLISVDGSFGIISNSDISNNGILYVNGDLVFKAKNEISLNGHAYAAKDTIFTAPTINQQGLLHVGGDMFVNTRAYNLVAHTGGKVELSTGEATKGEHYYFTRLRKDLHEIELNNIDLKTDKIYASPAETIVKGNLVIQSYDDYIAKNDSEKVQLEKAVINEVSSDIKSTLNVRDGRLYVGKSLQVAGNVDVSSTPYVVKVIDFLKFDSKINVSFTPITLINTKLSMIQEKSYDNLYDFFESVVNGETIDTLFYKSNAVNFINSLLMDQNIGPLMNKVLTSIFEADWKSANLSLIKTKWENFKKNSKDIEMVIFAPKSEVFAGDYFIQKGGHLNVGTDYEVSAVTKDEKEYIDHSYGHSEPIMITAIKNAVSTQKARGVQDVGNYVLSLKDFLKKYRDGSYSVKRDISMIVKPNEYYQIGMLNYTDYTKNIGDDASIALIVLEQIKDIGGATLSHSDKLKETFKKLVDTTPKYQEAVSSISEDKDRKLWVAKYGNQELTGTSYQDLRTKVDQEFDRIEFVKDDKHNGKYIPRVVLSTKTITSLTNFDKVASSLTAVDSIATIDNDFVKVNYSTLTSKSINLNSDGKISLNSQFGQFALNSNDTIIRTKKDFSITGNANFGNLQAQVEGNTSLKSLIYINNSGDLVNQSILKAKNMTLKTQDLKMTAARLFATGDLSIAAKEVTLKAEYNESSKFKSIAVENAWSGRQIDQIGRFVVGSHIEGKNINLRADENLNIESSNIIALDDANISVGGDLNSSAKQEFKWIDGRESKVVHSFNAKAKFGSWATYAETFTNLNYNLDGTVITDTQAFSDTETSLTSINEHLVQSSGGFVKDTTHYKHLEVTTANNNLDAKNLVVTVGGDAELGNTNINAINEGYTVDNELKSATISASSIKQDQRTNLRSIDIVNNGWGIRATAYGSSSIADLASHITSNVRSPSLYQQVSPKVALTYMSDLLGIATRDVVNGGIKTTIDFHKNVGEVEEYYESTNKFAGNLNLNANGDIKLKAVDGTNLGDLNITAKNLTIEGTLSKSTKNISAQRTEVGIGVSGGVSIFGGSASATVQASRTINKSHETATTHRNTVLSARNININLADELNLIAANLNAGNDASIIAKKINIETLNDIYASSSSSRSFGASAGIGFVGGVVPFGQIGGAVNFHKEEKEAPNEISSITAGNNLDIRTSSMKLTSAIIAAKSGNVYTDELENKNLKLTEYITGYEVGMDFGLNKNLTAVAGLYGSNDSTRKYNSTLHSLIDNNLSLTVGDRNFGNSDNPESVIYAKQKILPFNKSVVTEIVDNNLTRSSDKLFSVHQDENYQSIPFSVSLSTSLLYDAHKLSNAIRQKIKEYQKDTAKAEVSTTSNNIEKFDAGTSTSSNVVSREKINVTVNPKSSSIDSGTYRSANTREIASTGTQTDPVYTFEASSSYSPSFGRPHSDGSANGGFTNFDSSSSLGVSNHSSSSGSSAWSYSQTSNYFFNSNHNSSTDFSPAVAINTNGVMLNANNNPVKLTDKQLAFINILQETSKSKLNSFYNLTRIGNNSITTDNTIDSSKIFGIHSSTSNNLGGTFISFNNADKLFNKVEDVTSNSLIYYRPITQQFGSVFRNRDLEFDLVSIGNSEIIQNVDLSSYRAANTSVNYTDLTADDLNNSSDAGLDFSGSAIGSSGSTGSVDFNGNFGSSNSGYSVSNGNTELGIELSNDGNLIVDNPSGGRIDLPNIELPVVDTNNGNNSANITLPDIVDTSKPVITNPPIDNSTITLPDIPDVIDNGVITNIGGNSGNTSNNSLADSQNGSGSIISKEQGDYHNRENNLENEANLQDKESGKKGKPNATAEANGTVLTESEEKKDDAVEYTPGDNNAQDNELISVDSNNSVRKVSLGDMACYVLISNDNINASLPKSRVANTLFSTYSNAIVNSLGEGGVVCIPTASSLLQTDYNQYAKTSTQSSNSSLANNSIQPEELDVIVVVKQEAKYDRLLANSSLNRDENAVPKRTSVSFASARPSIQTKTEVVKKTITKKVQEKVSTKAVPVETNSLVLDIKRKLQARGIDASKLLLLSSKGGFENVIPNSNLGSCATDNRFKSATLKGVESCPPSKSKNK